jgi:hypothetical protein
MKPASPPLGGTMVFVWYFLSHPSVVNLRFSALLPGLAESLQFNTVLLLAVGPAIQTATISTRSLKIISQLGDTPIQSCLQAFRSRGLGIIRIPFCSDTFHAPY